MRTALQLLMLFLWVFSSSVAMAVTPQSVTPASEHTAPPPICVKDDRNRKVCLPKPAERIISLAPSITELLFEAGAGSHLVGVEGHSDFPAAAKQLPSIGKFPNISMEAILALQPDLVVVWADGNSDKTVSRLKQLGLSYYMAGPDQLEKIAITIEKLGLLAGTEPAADQQAEKFKSHLAQLQHNYSSQSPVPVFFEIWHQPLMTVGDAHFINQVINLCGGRSVFSFPHKLTATVTMETLLAKNPRVIITRPGNRQKLTRNWRDWLALHGSLERIIEIPDDLMVRPTSRLLAGAELLCQQLQRVRTESASSNNKQ